MKNQRTDTPDAASPKTAVQDDVGNEINLKAKSKDEDNNFYKIFMEEFEKSLKGINSQKLKLILWLIKHMTLKNEIKYSYREIAKFTGISLQTVTNTIKALEENNFLCRSNKKLIINPDAVFKGRRKKREVARYFYYEAKNNAKPLPEEERERIEQELDEIDVQLRNHMRRRKELEELKQLQDKIKELTRVKKILRERLDCDAVANAQENRKKPRRKKEDGKQTDAESQKKEDAPVSENEQVPENEQITENKQDAEDTQAPENA